VTLVVTLRPVIDWKALGERWRELEAHADVSFFQSWSWIGCLGPERYDDPVLLEARRDGRTVALGLFNRRPGLLYDTLLLHETGHPEWDALFIEHNGVMMETGADAALCAACLAASRHERLAGARAGLLGRRVVLAGVDSAHLAAASATATISRMLTRVAPMLDLAALRRRGQGHLDALSANTRAQLRRSLRRYARLGPLHIERADDAPTAHAFLDALAELHQAAWQHRGRPGAFANPRFARFHHALIDRALPRGEVDLLRVAAGSAVIGYLYNFRYRGRALAYQSGFDYAGADRQQKPGLTCHHLAIERSLGEGCEVYDFLAGNDRYKRSLADGETALHWLSLGPLLDPLRLRGAARRWLRADCGNR
jgi:CelD/BcsL family acetyltransferase involved in cellulose biosynthesis